MDECDNEKNDVSLENIDIARHTYRIFFFRLVILSIVGLLGSGWLLLKCPQIRIAGEGIAECIMIMTIAAIVILIWCAAYKISGLLHVPLILAIVSGPIILPIHIGKAAAKLGYRVGPFYSSLQPISPDTGGRRFAKLMVNGIFLLLLFFIVAAFAIDIHDIPLPQWITDTLKKPQNIAINRTIEKSPLNIPGYNQQQLERVAAIAAIYDRANNLPFDHFITNTSYITNPATDEESSAFRKMLSQWWDIDSRPQVFKTFRWLKNEGHRQQFAMMAMAFDSEHAVSTKNGADSVPQYKLQVVRDNYKKLGQNGIIAWDLIRLVYVAQASYYAGYISREEAWKEVIYAATTTQQLFTSWDEMAQSFLVGREFWSEDKDTQFSEIVKWMLTNADSPWEKNNWDIPLPKLPHAP